MFKITPGFEKGKCVICKKTTGVRLIIEDDKVLLKICEECGLKTNLSIEELKEKYFKP